jgi:hypothetical protein
MSTPGVKKKYKNEDKHKINIMKIKIKLFQKIKRIKIYFHNQLLIKALGIRRLKYES